MAVTTLDDSIANLQALIAALLEAKVQVQEATTTVDEQSSDIGRLESSAGETLGGFVEALAELSSALQQAEGDAVAQLDRVTEEAHRTAGERLAEMGRTVESEERELLNTLQVGHDDLDRDASGATSGGFQVLLAAAAAIQQEVGAAQQAAEAAFGAFATAVQGLQHDGDAAFDAGEQAIEAAVGGFTDRGDEVAAHAAQHETELQGRAQELTDDCNAAGDQASAAYASHVETVDAGAQELVDGVHGLGEDATAFVVAGSADQVDAPIAQLMGDALPPLEEELAHVEDLLNAADHTVADADALCHELERCQAVVDTIDQLLDAMQP